MKVGRFFLIYCLGWIGSLIINHTSLKPEGWKSRTKAYFWLWLIPPVGAIHQIVGAFAQFTFNGDTESNVGYFKA